MDCHQSHTFTKPEASSRYDRCRRNISSWCSKEFAFATVVLVVAGTSIWRFLVYFAEPFGEAYSDLYINYAGGFVRRGLLGAVALGLQEWLGFSPDLLFAVLILTSNIAVAVILLRLLWRRACDTTLLFVVAVSPATLLFTFHEPSAYARKDIFAIVLIALHTLYVRPRFLTDSVLAIALTASVLMHEAQAFLLGFHVLLLLQRGSARRLWVIAPALGGFLAVASYPGDAATQAAICASLQGKNCANFVAMTMTEAIQTGLDTLETAGEAFVIAGVLAFIPVWLVGRYPTRNAAPSGRMLAVASFALLPLFLLAADWGRWLHLMVMHLLLVMLATRDTVPVERTRFQISRPLNNIERFAFCYTYILGWQLLQGRPALFFGRVYEIVALHGIGTASYTYFIVAVLPALALTIGLWSTRWREYLVRSGKLPR